MRLHHLAFRTRDPADLARWYRDLFAFDELPAPRAGVCWLRAGDAVLMFEPALPGEPGVPPGSMEFTAFGTDAPGVEAFCARCALRSVAIEHRTAFTAYVRDPDGRRTGVSCFTAFPSPPLPR